MSAQSERDPNGPQSYSLAEIRNGTGWPRDARFVLLEPDYIDMDAIVERVQDAGHFAYVEQTGGGCATIYAGLHRVRSFEGETLYDGEKRYDAAAGPGWFEGPGWTKGRGSLHDFSVSRDDFGEYDSITCYDEDGAVEAILAVIKEQA